MSLAVFAAECAGLAVVTSACSGSSSSVSGNDSGACASDPDGVKGGQFPFDLAVSDEAFAPPILKAQDFADVKLTLTNKGTKSHGFKVGCIPAPNITGCPTTSCFPDASVIAPIAPDASATVTFVTPHVEGTYVFESSAAGDTMTGQFVVQ